MTTSQRPGGRRRRPDHRGLLLRLRGRPSGRQRRRDRAGDGGRRPYRRATAETEGLLAAIREREAQLDAEAKRLADRQQTLNVAEAKLAEQLAAFEEARAKLEETMALADNAAERDIATMTTVYENMKPADAALIFGEMDVTFAAGLLARLRPEVSAAILSSMPPAAAYAVTLTFASRNANVPTE